MDDELTLDATGRPWPVVVPQASGVLMQLDNLSTDGALAALADGAANAGVTVDEYARRIVERFSAERR